MRTGWEKQTNKQKKKINTMTFRVAAQLKIFFLTIRKIEVHKTTIHSLKCAMIYQVVVLMTTTFTVQSHNAIIDTKVDIITVLL